MNFTCCGLRIFDSCYRQFLSRGPKEDGRSSQGSTRALALPTCSWSTEIRGNHFELPSDRSNTTKETRTHMSFKGAGPPRLEIPRERYWFFKVCANCTSAVLELKASHAKQTLQICLPHFLSCPCPLGFRTSDV